TDTQSVQQILSLLHSLGDLSRYAISMRVQRCWTEEIANPRHADPKRLLRYGFKVYSQNDEDGIIQEIFRRVGVHHRTFVEFGVETGLECNTAKLLVEGWEGLWIEANASSAAKIRVNFAPFIAEQRLTVAQSAVTAENINDLLTRGGMR